MMACRRNDPDLNECIRKSIEMLRPKMSEGIPELMVPPCEPLTIPKINIKQNAGAIRMESDYTDVSVAGLSNFTLRSVRIDTANNKFRINLWFPVLKMTANYHIQGKLLLMSLAGKGPCRGNFSKLHRYNIFATSLYEMYKFSFRIFLADVDASVSMKHSVIQRNGTDYLKVDDIGVDFNIGDASVHLDNLFGGDKELGRVMNGFINENWREITAEIRPALASSIEHILREIALRVYELYPIQQILPD